MELHSRLNGVSLRCNWACFELICELVGYQTSYESKNDMIWFLILNNKQTKFNKPTHHD